MVLALHLKNLHVVYIHMMPMYRIDVNYKKIVEMASATGMKIVAIALKIVAIV